jgi:membrane-associated phospholipid phosphatase
MKNQSKATGFLSLYPIAGLIVFAAMTLILAEISEDIVNHEPITVTDAELSIWLHSHATPSLTKTSFVVTAFGSTAVVTCIAITFGLYLIRRRQFYWLAAMASSVAGGGLLNKILKYVFHRPRPFFPDPILKLSSYSFPSGHTMMATVLFGSLAAYLLSRTTNWPERVLIIVATACLIAIVGFSRMYLGAHYLSDVLAAIAEGLAWSSLCLLTVYSIWQRYGKKKTG